MSCYVDYCHGKHTFYKTLTISRHGVWKIYRLVLSYVWSEINEYLPARNLNLSAGTVLSVKRSTIFIVRLIWSYLYRSTLKGRLIYSKYFLLVGKRLGRKTNFNSKHILLQYQFIVRFNFNDRLKILLLFELLKCLLLVQWVFQCVKFESFMK